MAKKTLSQSNARRKPRSRASAPGRKQAIAATLAAIDEIKPVNPKAARVIALIKDWLSDESGYDEKVWPQLKKALDQERKRVGARSLFNG